jgi:hypothetical protein
MPRARKDKRAERTPLGSFRTKLNVADKDPAYEYRWVNDTPGRIEQAQAGGYEHVTDATTGETGETNTDVGSRTSSIVGRTEDGKGLRAYLMRIPKDFYDADQAEKQKVNDQIDEAIHGGSVEGEPGKDGVYVPKSGISYQP